MVMFNINTVLCPFLGGLLLSAATSLNLLYKGRITGVSSIISNLISFQKTGLLWRFSFVAGLFFASAIIFDIVGFHNTTDWFVLDTPLQYTADLDVWGWIIAGLAVGFGTRLGNGCTSGHGLCGLPRRSLRSFVAVCTFMSCGIAIATLRGYEPFLAENSWTDLAAEEAIKVYANVVLAVSVIFFAVCLVKFRKDQERKTDITVSFLTGAIFSIGLILSGMVRRSVVIGFLTLNENWNPAMMFVFMGGLLGNFIAFPKILKKKEPLFAKKFDIPNKTQIDRKLIGGAIIFGLGWGLGGLCPAPALIGSLFYMPHDIFLFFVTYAIGQFAASYFVGKGSTSVSSLPSKTSKPSLPEKIDITSLQEKSNITSLPDKSISNILDESTYIENP